MGLFTKQPSHKTVLILYIENGSVASAIARVAPGHAPHIVSQERLAVPLMDTRSAASLVRAVEHAASEALLRSSEAAARIRHHGGVPLYIDKVVVFLAAPWGTPNLAQGRPDFATGLTDTLRPRVASLFGDAPIALHAHASAAVHGLRTLYPHEHQALLLSVNGELSELLLLNDAKVVGHATAPVGVGHILRTLKSHAGLTLEEAHSALRLGHISEPLSAAAGYFAEEFGQVAGELMAHQPSSSVFVMAPGATAPWVARSLGHRSLAGLFPQGGVVRAIQGHHVLPFVSVNGLPDLHMSLNTLYTSAAHA
jgi:hypothetical protein